MSELDLEMSAQFESESENKKDDNKKYILDVITIDDDEEDYVDDDDETDDIEIIEVIGAKSAVNNIGTTSLSSNNNNCLPSISSDLKKCLQTFLTSSGSTASLSTNDTNCATNGSVTQELNSNSDNCVETIDDLSESNVETSHDSELENKSPKRVTFVTVCGSGASASTSCADNVLNVSTSEPTPPKVIRIEDLEQPQPSTSAQKGDYEALYQNYIKSFNERMSALTASHSQTEELVKKLDQIYNKLKSTDKKFLESSQFAKLMQMFATEVLELSDEPKVVRHHHDLILELNRLTQTKKTSIKVKNRAKRIKDLTSTLKKLQKQIYAAENEVYDFDAMNERTSYTDLPKLYRKVQEVWSKREELLRRSTNSGRIMFKKLKYNKTSHPEVNRCVENLFNTYMKRLKSSNKRGYIDESFTFIDVRKAIIDEINAKQLVVINSENLVVTVYKDLLTELRARRSKDSEEVFETLETLDDLRPETIAESNPQIELEIAKNKSYFERKMDELMQKYSNEDRRKNGESIALSNGLSEWDLALDENEEFESLDVKDGDLEEEDVEEEEEEEDKSDEEVACDQSSIPDFVSIPQLSEPTTQEAVATPDSTITATGAAIADSGSKDVVQ